MFKNPFLYGGRLGDRKTGYFSSYIGENFVVQMKGWFWLPALISEDSVGGIVTTNFIPRKELAQMHLTTGGYRLLTVPNAGGSSVISEVLSFELMGRCFSAKLKKTEMEVTYFPYGGPIMDYVCELHQVTVGVSVTRAMRYGGGEYTSEDASQLLNKKLKGIRKSTQNSLEPWSKQILHIWSISEHITSVLMQTYADVDPELKCNTVVMVTTVRKADYIFNNG
ncbi:AAC-rich mRNA aac4 protein [Bulinus truncatus]|nr:AAC-rich mRNA aac4 protein [Bulinus truncatus]